MKKRIIAALLAVFTVFAVFGCTPENNPNGGNNKRPTGTTITIYTGGSSEFTWVKGSKEDDVIEAIEQKYYDDTGVSLDFVVSYLGQDMKTKLNSAAAGGEPVDIAVSHTRGGDGIDDFLIKNNLFYDLSDDLEDYGSNVMRAIEGDPLYAVTTSDNKVIGIPSVIDPHKFGILVRKDRMEAVGYTDDPAKAQTEYKSGQNYILVDNLEDFTDMCVAVNLEYGKSYAVSGAIWDIEKVLTLGAFGNAGRYTYAVDSENNAILNGSAFPYYLDVLKLEYDWADKGVISKNADGILKEEAEQAFYGGTSSVFVLDPTIGHLIEVARKCKEINDEAEFTVLGALREKRDKAACKYKDNSGEPLKGFMRNSWATFAAGVISTSRNSVAIMKFLNWVYKNADNYNLCRYGREGVDWVNNGDGTYSYPDESYVTDKPYSGILTLVENQRISNLTYRDSTADEKRWLAIAADPENYIENDIIDYLLPDNASLSTASVTADGNLRGNCLVPAWTGKTDPMADGGANFTTLANNYRTQSLSYGNFRYNAYVTMKNSRSESNS